MNTKLDTVKPRYNLRTIKLINIIKIKHLINDNDDHN